MLVTQFKLPWAQKQAGKGLLAKTSMLASQGLARALGVSLRGRSAACCSKHSSSFIKSMLRLRFAVLHRKSRIKLSFLSHAVYRMVVHVRVSQLLSGRFPNNWEKRFVNVVTHVKLTYFVCAKVFSHIFLKEPLSMICNPCNFRMFIRISNFCFCTHGIFIMFRGNLVFYLTFWR